MSTQDKVRSEVVMDISASGGKKVEEKKDSSARGAISKVMLSGDGEPLGKTQKRTHSEVSETSLEELAIIHTQLDTVTAELKETKDSMKNLMTKSDIADFITKTVESVLKGIDDRMKKMVEEQVEVKVKDRVNEINNRLDYLTFENVEIKERLDKVENKLKKQKEKTKAALEQSNYNEQFSRKNNVKVMGVEVLEDETEVNLTEEIISIVRQKTHVNIQPSEIVALHRIPSKHNPKPVLVKFINNSVKTRLMKHRKIMKQQGYKLVDDVTKKNTELIGKLLKHDKIESAWFFNGFIYGKTTEGRRHKFDLFSDIDAVITPKKKEGEDDEEEAML